MAGECVVAWNEGFEESESSLRGFAKFREKFGRLSDPCVVPLRSVDWPCAENWGMGLGGLLGVRCWDCGF